MWLRITARARCSRDTAGRRIFYWMASREYHVQCGGAGNRPGMHSFFGRFRTENRLWELDAQTLA